ncbi:MAG TPA: hypothetical protein VN028_02440, partial [Rhodocyclaceae bacterium]|nr:hypothetical protein [Rhodocyclaceae bacterium]
KIFGEESASAARPTHTQDDLIRKNIRAHKEANYEIRKRFNQKWDEIVGGKKAKHAGQWWASKFGGKAKSFNELNRYLSQNAIKKSALRTEYLQDKLARHGITYVNK